MLTPANNCITQMNSECVIRLSFFIYLVLFSAPALMKKPRHRARKKGGVPRLPRLSRGIAKRPKENMNKGNTPRDHIT